MTPKERRTFPYKTYEDRERLEILLEAIKKHQRGSREQYLSMLEAELRLIKGGYYEGKASLANAIFILSQLSYVKDIKICPKEKDQMGLDLEIDLKDRAINTVHLQVKSSWNMVRKFCSRPDFNYLRQRYNLVVVNCNRRLPKEKIVREFEAQLQKLEERSLARN